MISFGGHFPSLCRWHWIGKIDPFGDIVIGCTQYCNTFKQHPGPTTRKKDRPSHSLKVAGALAFEALGERAMAALLWAAQGGIPGLEQPFPTNLASACRKMYPCRFPSGAVCPTVVTLLAVQVISRINFSLAIFVCIRCTFKPWELPKMVHSQHF